MSDYKANDALASGFDRFEKGRELEEEMQQLPVTDPETLRKFARAMLTLVGLPALMDVYVDPDAGHGVKMDANRQLMELGDMKPKMGQVAQQGAMFHVTINAPAGFTPGAPPAPSEQAIINITPPPADPLLIPEPEPAPVEEAPKPFTVPDFNLSPDPAPAGLLPTPRT